jgi:predicted Zn-dependent protease
MAYLRHSLHVPAERHFVKAAALGPERLRPYALCALGATRVLDGRPAEALDPLSSALAAHPGNATCRSSYGVALLRVGERGQARTELERAVAAAPMAVLPLTNLLRGYEELGAHCAAAGVCRRAPPPVPIESLAEESRAYCRRAIALCGG